MVAAASERTAFDLLVLAGDGVGPEITAGMLRVADWFAARLGLELRLTHGLVGGASIEAHDTPITDEVAAQALAADAVLFGAVGGPQWDARPVAARPEAGILRLRKDLDLYANLRPAICYPELADASALKREIVEGLDILIVRETTAGVYFGQPRGVEDVGGGVTRAYDTQAYRSDEIERVVRTAFEIAQGRGGRLCSVDKANVMETGAFWRRIADRIAPEYPDVALSHMYADNCAMQLVRAPKQFDVIVTDNLFGDILSDAAAALVGSLGMLPSATLGPVGADGRRRALYEPIHGSAPDIAGQGIANPLAAILSFGMCLRWTMDRPAAADLLDAAVRAVVAEGVRTRDIAPAGSAGVATTEMTDAVLARLDQLADSPSPHPELVEGRGFQTRGRAMTHELNRVLRDIAGRRDELVALTQDLIRFPTINPPGDAYRPCAEYIGERLKRRGFEVTYVRGEGSPGDSDRYPRINVVARWQGPRPGPCVHFNSHIDVVQAGAGWTMDPFEGVVRDGRVYGRGACDMKGGLAASIIAAEALIDSGLPLPGAIEISGTVDEESGGYGGVAYLAERGWFSHPRVDHVIIPEPLNVDRVCIGHRGVWWAEIETKGRIAHGSMPFLGDSAIRHMGAVLEQFEQRLYPAMAARHTEMPVVPDGARSSTMNINSIHGGPGEHFEGLPAPCVVDSCRIVIDRRFLIEETLGGVKDEVREILDGLAATRPDFRYQMRDLFEVIPTMADRDGPVASATAAAIRSVLGKEPQFICSPGTYDQKHVDRIGKLKDCIAYGPGVLDLAHQPDEWVGIDDMVASAKVMALATAALMGMDAGADRSTDNLQGEMQA